MRTRDRNGCLLFALVVVVAASVAANSGQDSEDGQKQVSFMNDVAPILKENCFACHDAKKRKGKLDMTSFAKLMRGGNQGSPVVAGKPDESLLWLLTAGEEEPMMPPKEAGERLTKDRLAVLKRWIEQGAKFDGPGPDTDLIAELRRRWIPPMPPLRYQFPTIVRAVAFTAEDKQLIVGGYHEILVWDLEAEKLLARLRTRAERINALLLLPDGQTLAAAGGRPGQEGDVRLYNLDELLRHAGTEPKILDGVEPSAGFFVRELVRTDDEILCLALSKDGKQLAAAGCDRTIRVWNVADKFKLSQTIDNHADWVFGVAFSPDGKRLFTCSRDKTAKVWDLTAKESVLTFPQHQKPVFALAVRADGKVAVTGGEDRQLRYWNTTGEGKQIRAVGGHGNTIWKLLWHPKQPWVVSASSDATVRIWDADNGKLIRLLKGHRDWIYSLALSHDRELVASGSWDGEVRVWRLKTGELVKALQVSPGYKPAAAGK